MEVGDPGSQAQRKHVDIRAIGKDRIKWPTTFKSLC